MSLPSSPQVILQLLLPFLPKHVARFWAFILMFFKYCPRLWQPCLHHPKLMISLSTLHTPMHAASTHTDQAASCPAGFTFTYYYYYFFVSSCRPASSSYPCLSPLETYNVCERVEICKAIQTWPMYLRKESIQMNSGFVTP